MNSALSEVVASTLLVVGALFPIVNPLGNTPIFLMLTRGLSEQGRAKLARTIAVNGLVLMVAIDFHRHPHPRVLRNFAPRSAGGRRAGGGFDRVGVTAPFR